MQPSNTTLSTNTSPNLPPTPQTTSKPQATALPMGLSAAIFSQPNSGSAVNQKEFHAAPMSDEVRKKTAAADPELDEISANFEELNQKQFLRINPDIDGQKLSTLLNQIRSSEISHHSRISKLHNLFRSHFSKAGVIDYSICIKVIDYLVKIESLSLEKEYLVALKSQYTSKIKIVSKVYVPVEKTRQMVLSKIKEATRLPALSESIEPAPSSALLPIASATPPICVPSPSQQASAVVAIQSQLKSNSAGRAGDQKEMHASAIVNSGAQKKVAAENLVKESSDFDASMIDYIIDDSCNTPNAIINCFSAEFCKNGIWNAATIIKIIDLLLAKPVSLERLSHLRIVRERFIHSPESPHVPVLDTLGFIPPLPTIHGSLPQQEQWLPSFGEEGLGFPNPDAEEIDGFVKINTLKSAGSRTFKAVDVIEQFLKNNLGFDRDCIYDIYNKINFRTTKEDLRNLFGLYCSDSKGIHYKTCIQIIDCLITIKELNLNCAELEELRAEFHNKMVCRSAAAVALASASLYLAADNPKERESKVKDNTRSKELPNSYRGSAGSSTDLMSNLAPVIKHDTNGSQSVPQPYLLSEIYKKSTPVACPPIPDITSDGIRKRYAMDITPVFNSYKIGNLQDVAITAVSKRPSDLFLEALFGAPVSMEPGRLSNLFSFTHPHKKLLEAINTRSPETIIKFSATGQQALVKYNRGLLILNPDSNLGLVGDLTDVYGKETVEFSIAEIQSILDSQKIYTAPELPVKFYVGLVQAMRSDLSRNFYHLEEHQHWFTLTGSDDCPVVLSQLKTVPEYMDTTAFLKEVEEQLDIDPRVNYVKNAKAPENSFGFKFKGDYVFLLNCTLYQIGSLVVKSSDNYLLVDGGMKLRPRKAGANDKLRQIDLSGIRGIHSSLTPSHVNQQILTSAFRSALVAGGTGIILFPAVGMGVWGGDPDVYWKAFLDAISTTGTALKQIYVNPAHKASISRNSEMSGKQGEEFAKLLETYIEQCRKKEDIQGLNNLRKIANLIDTQKDIYQLGYNLKEQFPNEQVSIVNASDPDVTLGGCTGMYALNFPHIPTTEENLAVTTVGFLQHLNRNTTYKDPSKVIQVG